MSGISTGPDGTAAGIVRGLGTPAALKRVAALAIGLFLFVGALQLMKTGAAALDVLQEGSILVGERLLDPRPRLAGALIVLSGSPVAATSLALVAAGEETAARAASASSRASPC